MGEDVRQALENELIREYKRKIHSKSPKKKNKLGKESWKEVELIENFPQKDESPNSKKLNQDMDDELREPQFDTSWDTRKKSPRFKRNKSKKVKGYKASKHYKTEEKALKTDYVPLQLLGGGKGSNIKHGIL